MDHTDAYCGTDCSCAYPQDCPYYEPQLEDRNEGPTNRFGCSYLDCGCTEPCTITDTSETISSDVPAATTTIVVNGGNVTINL